MLTDEDFNLGYNWKKDGDVLDHRGSRGRGADEVEGGYGVDAVRKI